MKYLTLLFLFLSLGVKGQTWVTEYESDGNVTVTDSLQADRNPNDFYVDSLIDLRKGIPGINFPHPLNIVPYNPPYYFNPIAPQILSLEEKLLQYASECWNDSTPFGLVGYVHHADGKLTELPREYIHREPTLKGFIQYLKKK